MMIGNPRIDVLACCQSVVVTDGEPELKVEALQWHKIFGEPKTYAT